ncbi:YaaA family protein [Candidatus Cetobacterium colombiensis]|uniref:UPF0246 protein RFV38_09945 n=1 Tax=Candidatus Cetobacterium colombiensis TaxID=3073100 RepID=A0ABU4WB94_9FUSO|nr:YaaA family protein [Candidatus Cetobacterium colombiensis]MDX8336810.1 YaaA family protein [Candidatus Cetobacterium colombiensis]
MKLFFSPSKGMKYKNHSNLNTDYKKDEKFQEETFFLVSAIKKFDKEELGKRLKIKDKILNETFELYQNYYSQLEREAISLYDGVSFKQLELDSFTKDNFKYISENVFIFSALYGILNACTSIRPYRLDMTNKILDLSPYEFWSSKIENDLLEYKDEIFINIASKEFSKILNRKIFNIIDIEFRQLNGDTLKNISTEAKKGRGAMLNYLIKNKVDTIEKIKNFSNLGYVFSKELSSNKEFIFIKSN